MLRIEGLKLINGKVLSFELSQGEVLRIEGKNGVGKSLLLKSLARLVPIVSGKGLDNDSVEIHRSRLLYLPPNVTFEADETVESFLDEPFKLAIYHHYQSTFNPKLYLSDILSKKMALLSSGQKQYVAILRALSLKAQILLLDEPFAHIDHAKRIELAALLADWVGESKAIILVTHDDVSFPHLKMKSLILDE